MDFKDISLEIKQLDKNNWEQILSLSVSESQAGFIETSKRCLQDAKTNAYDMEWNFYGIYTEDTLIGFAMHGLGDVAYISDTKLWLDRFMIDAQYQGKGYGKMAMLLVMKKLLEDYNKNEIYLSVHDDNFSAISLYETLGFTFTGQVDPMGELVMVYQKVQKQLTEKNVTKKLSNYNEVKAFMGRVFPKDELMPLWFINLLTQFKKYEFKAYYDGDLFVGVLFTIETTDTLFVFYIAVNDKLHSKGYGTKLLQILFEKYPHKSITLFIETMDDTSAINYEQRVKRLAFYQRNGFVQTGIKAGFKMPFVDILSTDETFDIAKAKKLMKLIPMKIFNSNEKG
ncbi:MAG: GNAT family N-acetyltransferase [Eubacteriales bacterium]